MRKQIVSALTVMFLLTACGGEAPQDQQPAAPAPTRTATTVESPDATAPPAPTSAAESGSQSVPQEQGAQVSGLIRLPSVNAGLTQLGSYRARFTFLFEGKDENGEQVNTQSEVLQEVAENKDQRLRMSNASQNNAIEMFTIGDVRYMYSQEVDEAKCISFSSDDAISPPDTMFSPQDILGDTGEARLEEKAVMLNGVRTDRYVIEMSQGMGLLSGGEMKAEAWVAQEGNFLVRYKGTATGKTILFDNAEGTITWDYQLEDINNVSEIELPEICAAQAPAADIPLPDNATERSQFGGVTSFLTEDSPEDVAEFYQTELPRQGWGEKEVSELGNLRLLTFTKGERTLNITINPDDKGTTVLIVETR